MKITEKITCREQLVNVLTDNYIDNDRADVVSRSVYVLSKERFDELFSEYQEMEQEIGEDYITLIYDESITAIAEDLIGLTDNEIQENFGSYYSYNTIATDEDGRGMLFIQG